VTAPLRLFAIATLGAPTLLGLGAVLGGVWAVAGLVWMTLLTATLDEAVARATENAPEGAEFPHADTLSVALAAVHFALLALVVAALAGRTGLAGWERVVLFFGAVQFMGQVSNSNAHELIHRGARWLHGLGKWVYISMLYGQHASAHLLVHHVHAATKNDPNSARRGEGLYRFIRRAWPGEFRAGLAAERARAERAGRPRWRNPYLSYLAGGAGFLALAALIGGPVGLAGYIGLSLMAQVQLLMSDYVQHYGLQRRPRPDGRPEPMGVRHSWNAPHWFSSALMLNAPRHSDHHTHPARVYPALRLTEDMPVLPRSLPAMATLALFPRLWRRVMDPRVADWQDGAERPAPGAPSKG